MPMLRTIERPTKATLRPWSWAASSTCWMRCTWLAKLDTMTRPGRGAEDLLDRRRELALGGGEAGDLGVGRVGEEEVDALLAQPGEGAQVGDPAVERELVHLEVAGVQHQPGGGADGDGQPVGDRVVDGDELAVERAERARGRPRATSTVFGVMRCSLSLASMKASVSLEPTTGMSGALAQQVGHAADVVLVAVGEHDRVDLVEAVPDPGEVGQDHVDAGLVLLGEEHAAVDDEQPAGVLEDRHVAADLTQAAQRDDPQAVARQRGQVLGPPRAAPRPRDCCRRPPPALTGHALDRS